MRDGHRALRFSQVGFSGEIIRDSVPGVRFGKSPNLGVDAEFWAERAAEERMLRAPAKKVFISLLSMHKYVHT